MYLLSPSKNYYYVTVSFRWMCVIIKILTCKVLCVFLLNYLQDKYSIINQK